MREVLKKLAGQLAANGPIAIDRRDASALMDGISLLEAECAAHVRERQKDLDLLTSTSRSIRELLGRD